MATTISHSPADTLAYGRALATAARGGEIFALCGDLGAGKTHLAKGIAAGLGCDPDEVTSPTFTLIHEYPGRDLTLFHFDFYRLENNAEVLRLGLDDYLGGSDVVIVEWADKFPELLPLHTRWITLQEDETGGRIITERTP